MKQSPTILLGLAIVLASITEAAATVDADCAVVLKTPDGFLALRVGPGTRFEMKKKLKQGDFLVFHQMTMAANGWKWTSNPA